jgi:hypothetical protein
LEVKEKATTFAISNYEQQEKGGVKNEKEKSKFYRHIRFGGINSSFCLQC